MTTSGSGGYLLHAIKVYVLICEMGYFENLTSSSFDDETAESALTGFRQRAKRKKADLKMETDVDVVDM